MTQKDYVLLARAIADMDIPDAGIGFAPSEIRPIIACGIADALATDNPRFDRERFMAACGLR